MKLLDLTKRISFVLLVVLILFFSISSIQANDVNGTILNSNDDIALSFEEDVQLEIDGNSSEQNIKNQTQLSSLTTKAYYNGNYEVTLIDSNTNKSLANKTVNISIDDVDYSANTNSNGTASVNLKLNPGNHLVTAYFEGDDNFNASNNISGNVKLLTTIKSKDVKKYYKGSKNYQATYLDSMGNVLKNKKVAITVNGKKYTKKTNSNGVASFAVNLKPGTYKVSTTNPRTGENLTTTFKILSTVSASDLKKLKGDSKKFVAKFLKSDGKALAKQQVKVKINGKTYKYKTSSKGKLKLSFNNFKKGTYKVICYNNDGLSKTSTVKIYKKVPTKIKTSTYTFLTNDTKVIKVKFSTDLDDDSKSGKSVSIFINGMSYSKKTDRNGEINFKLPSLAPDVYFLECEFQGDNAFKYSSDTKYITILNTSNAEFTVKSTTSFGNFTGTPLVVAMAAGDVPLMGKTVIFNINGENYTNKTNIFGLVSAPINLDAGDYVIDYRFSGDSKVKETIGSCNITVRERINAVLTGNYRTIYNDTLQSFNVYLKDSNGTPLYNESVELIIDGETYTGLTDNKGYACIKSVAPMGKYDFSVVFQGNNNYNPASKSGSTKVILSNYANGINEKNANASSSYLKATKNCQVKDEKIQSLVKFLTKGLTSDVDKAKAIFDYVQLNIDYEYYKNSKKGAVGTLDSMKGNGADQAHLLVAMFRAAGLNAKYVHGDCTFYMDGKTYGHIWTQVLVDNTWVCADSTDLANQFGKITTWNVNKFTLLNKYRELPF